MSGSIVPGSGGVGTSVLGDKLSHCALGGRDHRLRLLAQHIDGSAAAQPSSGACKPERGLPFAQLAVAGMLERLRNRFQRPAVVVELKYRVELLITHPDR